MFLTYFEYKTRQIDAEKGKANFIKKYGKEYMRAFQEEMEYFSYKILVDETLDLNVELDRIEAKYRFNDDMNLLLDVTAQPLRNAVTLRFWELKNKAKASKDADNEIKELCRIMIEQMTMVHIYEGDKHYTNMSSDEATELNHLRVILEKIKNACHRPR